MTTSEGEISVDPFPEDWADIAWAKLPADIKRTAYRHIRYCYPPEFFDDIAARVREYGLGDWLPNGWHFTKGMEIRNDLRDVVADAELPPLPEFYGPSQQGNWDDYYVQVVEAAAGCREVT